MGAGLTVFERFTVKAKGCGNPEDMWGKKFLRINNMKNGIKIQNGACIIDMRLETHRSYAFQNFRGEITY